MALSAAQNAAIVFKKIAANRANTSMNKEYYEESFDTNFESRISVYPDDIWAQADLIPVPAPSGTNPIVEERTRTLISVPGTQSFYHPDLKNAIPYYVDPNNLSYVYDFRTSTNTKIDFGQGDWFFDTNAGVVTFFGNSMPPGVSESTPPKMTCYVYIGSTGLSVSSSGSSTDIRNLDWQNLINGIVTDSDFVDGVTLSDSVDLYIDYDATNLSSSYTIVDGSRFIYSSGSTVASFTNLYEPNTDTVYTDDINPGDIVEYWDSTSRGTSFGGWVVTSPKTYMTVNNELLDVNELLRWDSNWIKTSYQVPQKRDTFEVLDTVDNISIFQLLTQDTLTNKPLFNTSIEVELNSLELNLHHTDPSISFGVISDGSAETISSPTTTTYESDTDIPVGTIIKIVDTLALTYYRNILNKVAGSTLTWEYTIQAINNPIATVTLVNIDSTHQDIDSAYTAASNNINDVKLLYVSDNANHLTENDDFLEIKYHA